MAKITPKPKKITKIPPKPKKKITEIAPKPKITKIHPKSNKLLKYPLNLKNDRNIP